MFADKIPQLETYFDNLPRKVADRALKFFDNSWTNKGFTDGSLKKWKPVIDPKTGKEKERPLVKSVHLRGSLRDQVKGNEITISTDVPYAEIHNAGGQVKGKFAVNEHYRKKPSGGKSKVKAHTRNVNHTMPQRQFMGPSETFDQQMQEMIIEDLDKILG